MARGKNLYMLEQGPQVRMVNSLLCPQMVLDCNAKGEQQVHCRAFLNLFLGIHADPDESAEVSTIVSDLRLYVLVKTVPHSRRASQYRSY